MLSPGRKLNWQENLLRFHHIPGPKLVAGDEFGKFCLGMNINRRGRGQNHTGERDVLKVNARRITGTETRGRRVQKAGGPHGGGGTQAESSKLYRCALGRQGGLEFQKREESKQKDEARPSGPHSREAAMMRGWLGLDVRGCHSTQTPSGRPHLPSSAGEPEGLSQGVPGCSGLHTGYHVEDGGVGGRARGGLGLQ